MGFSQSFLFSMSQTCVLGRATHHRVAGQGQCSLQYFCLDAKPLVLISVCFGVNHQPSPSALRQCTRRAPKLCFTLGNSQCGLVYWLSYIPALIHSHMLWLVTESIRLQLQAAETRFHLRVSNVSFAGRAGDQKVHRAEMILLHTEGSQFRSGHLSKMLSAHLPGELVLIMSNWEEILWHAHNMFLCWLGNATVFPYRKR